MRSQLAWKRHHDGSWEAGAYGVETRPESDWWHVDFQGTDIGRARTDEQAKQVAEEHNQQQPI